MKEYICFTDGGCRMVAVQVDKKVKGIAIYRPGVGWVMSLIMRKAGFTSRTMERAWDYAREHNTIMTLKEAQEVTGTQLIF